MQITSTLWFVLRDCRRMSTRSSNEQRIIAFGTPLRLANYAKRHWKITKSLASHAQEWEYIVIAVVFKSHSFNLGIRT